MRRLYILPVLIGLYKFSTSFFLAKKSITNSSKCDPDSAWDLLHNVLKLPPEKIEYLKTNGILSTFGFLQEQNDSIFSNGCWMQRRVDAMSVIVVDALRFDFASDHLPQSIGSRLRSVGNKHQSSYGHSQLFRFVADPPTVTMQRLKGLTTGGLPTFADISGSFGGANIDEDSWIQQQHDVPSIRRGYKPSSVDITVKSEWTHFYKMAFVGDDTWIDLFPSQFDEAYPFPSFNTRDLDTVDNGCIDHLPRFLEKFGVTNENGDSFLEAIVIHFLGVDHVGHTYGPHNEHMEQKLHQIDGILNTILTKVDSSSTQCEVAFIFGDHGMTEDGNHGGATSEETIAGLFAHFSPGCGDFNQTLSLDGQEAGSHSIEAFQSINQIDLVPTISFLLGLPVPFANLGGVIPGLLPPLYHKTQNETNELVEAPFAAVALALNAAQVWRYLTTYSSSANRLPRESMSEIEHILFEANQRLTTAISEGSGFDSLSYREACGLYKYFLSQATDLGKQVWTRFDSFGMVIGLTILSCSLFLWFPPLFPKISSPIHSKAPGHSTISKLPDAIIERKRKILFILTVLFLMFHCILLTFSNSYIISEQSIILFMISMICVTESFFRGFHCSTLDPSTCIKAAIPIIIVICARGNGFVMGHGQDPMIRKNWSHRSDIFLTSLLILATSRVAFGVVKRKHINSCITHTVLDVTALVFLAISWYEKRFVDVSRHGYTSSFVAIVLCVVGLFLSALDFRRFASETKVDTDTFFAHIVWLIKVLIFTISVTGPSSATSALVILLQAYALWYLSNETGRQKFQGFTLGFLWRLIIRSTFFVTGHACSFNRLQLSAAFVATETFYYTPAGISLFFNTFGWDMMGTLYAAKVCKECGRSDAWNWFCFYQVLETLFCCISVTFMRRHLMVWSIFAPRFVFSAVWLLIVTVGCLLNPIPKVFRRIDKSQ